MDTHRHPSGFITVDFSSEERAALLSVVDESEMSSVDWGHGQGKAPAYYLRGMTVAFAAMLVRLDAADPYVANMARGLAPKNDVLVKYAGNFGLADGIGNHPATTLQALLTIMVSLGMHESSGRHCCGKDVAEQNVSHDTAEAGLFQTSWNASYGVSALAGLLECYQGRTDLLDIFRTKCAEANLKNWGEGIGVTYQKTAKECPAFAIDFTAVAMRHMRRHWYPINKDMVTVSGEAFDHFTLVANVLRKRNLLP